MSFCFVFVLLCFIAIKFGFSVFGCEWSRISNAKHLDRFRSKLLCVDATIEIIEIVYVFFMQIALQALNYLSVIFDFYSRWKSEMVAMTTMTAITTFSLDHSY